MKDPNMYDKIVKLSNSGKSIREIMKETGLKSTSSVTYYLKMHQDPTQKRKGKIVAKIHHHEREIQRLKTLLQTNTETTTLMETMILDNR